MRAASRVGELDGDQSERRAGELGRSREAMRSSKRSEPRMTVISLESAQPMSAKMTSARKSENAGKEAGQHKDDAMDRLQEREFDLLAHWAPRVWVVGCGFLVVGS